MMLQTYGDKEIDLLHIVIVADEPHKKTDGISEMTMDDVYDMIEL